MAKNKKDSLVKGRDLPLVSSDSLIKSNKKNAEMAKYMMDSISTKSNAVSKAAAIGAIDAAAKKISSAVKKKAK